MKARVGVLLAGLALLGACSGGDADDGAGGAAGSGPASGGGGAGQSGGPAAGASAGGSSASSSGGAGSDASSGAGRGAIDAGSGGSSGTADGVSKTEACLEYGAARLARSAECNGDPVRSEEELKRTFQDCPDQYFSDGSTRTVAGLLDCAEQMRTFPCGELRAGRVPPCVTPGTRAGGEPCAYLTQCASLRCTEQSAELEACGTCAAPVGAGESCDGVVTVCPINHGCDEGVCTELPRERPTPPPVEPPMTLPTGAVCANHGECTPPDLCFDTPEDDTQHCVTRVALGDFCGAPTTYCFDEHFCDPNDDTCKVMPGNGEPCGLHFGEPAYCADYLRCELDDPAGATCRPLPGFECELAGTPCGVGTTCCPEPDCPTATCLRGLGPGEACGDADARCVHGTACVAGVCEVDDTLHIFTERCEGP